MPGPYYLVDDATGERLDGPRDAADAWPDAPAGAVVEAHLRAPGAYWQRGAAAVRGWVPVAADPRTALRTAVADARARAPNPGTPPPDGALASLLAARVRVRALELALADEIARGVAREARIAALEALVLALAGG